MADAVIADRALAIADRAQAWSTLTSYTTSEALLRRALAVEAATASYARRFGEDEELWRIAALLHVVDAEINPALDQHPRERAPVLPQEGLGEEDIGPGRPRADAPLTRDTLLERTLYACDELSRFVHACALLRPTGLDGLKPRSVRAILRQPSFAPGVSRDGVIAGSRLLGVELDDHITNVISALRPIARELGLRTAEDPAGASEPGEDQAPARRPAAMVVTGWYARYFDLDQVQVAGARLGLVFVRAACRRQLIVTALTRWAVLAAIVSSLLRRRQVVLLELQRLPLSGWRAVVVRLARPLIGRGVAAAQVLSSWEVDACHRWLGIPAERIRFIPWPLHGIDPGPETRSGYVLASGRAACDWKTLFHAAEEAEWPLTVVCKEADAREVERLGAGGRARIFVEIPRDLHHRLLRQASVYVLPLVERHHGAGHIRIMDAISTMTPVVTTRIRGLVDYVVPDESALVVEPGDAAGLREAVDRLLRDPPLRTQLTERALDLFGGRTLEEYEKDIRALVYSAAKGAEP